ncbi:MAG: acyltransferase family protein [Prevotella sp.]|nr:acyltransferase family protein [Prevotella sp.]
MTKRIEFVDLAKGICILLVVLLHVFGDMSGVVIKIMNLFRMPLYFVLSGLFFKTYNGLIPFLKKKTNKLLIPFFFIFVFVVIPTTIMLDIKTGAEISWSSVILDDNGKLNLGIDGTIWFLLCLFFANIIYYIIFLISKRNIVAIILLSCLCGISGYMLNVYNQFLLIWSDSALTALPFFMFGYVLRKHTSVLNEQFSKIDFFFFIVSLGVLLLVYFVNEIRCTDVIGFARNEYNVHILLLYLGGTAGTLCVLMLSKYFGHLPIISYIGRYSIVVLLTHLLYLFAIRNLLYQAGIDQGARIDINIAVFVVIILLMLPTIKFCIKYLPYCFAQKDLWK